MKSDLDQIAINDMKHELCDMRPCHECADFKYQVFSNDTVLGTYYGSNACGEDGKWYNAGRQDALDFAAKIAKALYEAGTERKIFVKVFDQNEMPTEESCRYEFNSYGKYTKIG